MDGVVTGCSSLVDLNRFPIDWLTIDRSVVSDLLDDPTDLTIIGLGHTRDLKVVAEGVQQQREAALLLRSGATADLFSA